MGASASGGVDARAVVDRVGAGAVSTFASIFTTRWAFRCWCNTPSGPARRSAATAIEPGIAAAALATAFLVKWLGWRWAFVVPGLVCIGCGIVFWRLAPRETEPPSARSRKASVELPAAQLARAFAVMAVAATANSLSFNMTTNGNAQLLAERMHSIVQDRHAGSVVAAVYALSLAQVVCRLTTASRPSAQAWAS
jgi:MFS family permease